MPAPGTFRASRRYFYGIRAGPVRAGAAFTDPAGTHLERRSLSHRDIIVIGGSSGATTPIKTILGSLPRDLPAAVFIVVHVPSRSLGFLATISAAAVHLPVHAAVDGLAIQSGHIYLGVPDHHLILSEDRIRLGCGPRENLARPAIDPLFRSAAAAFGPRVIGILLSGMLNDGVSGLQAIKRCGGVTLVQDPDEAIADEMPRNALSNTEVDFILPAVRMADVLPELVRQPAGPPRPVPADITLEVEIAAGGRIDSEILRPIAKPVALSCPACGGVLSEIVDGAPLRFRCQVGHAYSAEVLAKKQEDAVDEALRVALRIVEERAELVRRMAEDGRQAGRMAVSEMYEAREAEYRRYADTIRQAILHSLPPSEPSDHGRG